MRHNRRNIYALFPNAAFGAAKASQNPPRIMSRKCDWKTGLNACIYADIRLR